MEDALSGANSEWCAAVMCQDQSRFPLDRADIGAYHYSSPREAYEDNEY